LRWEDEVELEFIYIIHNERRYNTSNVVPERRFECKVSFAVKEEVFGKTGPILAESLIELNKR